MSSEKRKIAYIDGKPYEIGPNPWPGVFATPMKCFRTHYKKFAKYLWIKKPKANRSIPDP